MAGAEEATNGPEDAEAAGDTGAIGEPTVAGAGGGGEIAAALLRSVPSVFGTLGSTVSPMCFQVAWKQGDHSSMRWTRWPH